MVAIANSLAKNEKEALLIMFGKVWQQRFWSLDGKGGRPSISQCIDFALRKKSRVARDDLIGFLENYLVDMTKRCSHAAMKDGKSPS